MSPRKKKAQPKKRGRGRPPLALDGATVKLTVHMGPLEHAAVLKVQAELQSRVLDEHRVTLGEAVRSILRGKA